MKKCMSVRNVMVWRMEIRPSVSFVRMGREIIPYFVSWRIISICSQLNERVSTMGAIMFSEAQYLQFRECLLKNSTMIHSSRESSMNEIFMRWFLLLIQILKERQLRCMLWKICHVKWRFLVFQRGFLMHDLSNMLMKSLFFRLFGGGDRGYSLISLTLFSRYIREVRF